MYLEFSIIGGNSPFNNYKISDEFTVLSLTRIRNIRFILESIISNNVYGDILEAGNWRGGSMLYAKGILEAYGIKNKQIWMFDTFSGFPNYTTITDKNEERTFIKGKIADKMRSNSINKVKSLFEMYNLSNGVNFGVGDFRYTLFQTSIPKISYLRLDADNYFNTIFLLNNLYDKLNTNGYIELDDYGTYPGCKKAVDEFRIKKGITNPIIFEYEHPGKDKYFEAIYWIK